MAWTFSRAAQAMLITSLTTGAAFVMNLSSEVPAIQIFGGFAAFMILFNYLFVISYFPCIVVIYELYLQYCPSVAWLCFRRRQPDESASAVHDSDDHHGQF
jgi:hypothetical protein